MDEEELGLKDKKAGSDSLFKKYDDVNSGKVKLTGKASLSNQMTSTYRGQNTGLGKSKYDKNIVWDADVNPDDIQGSINEHRYNEQSGGTQLLAGVGRAATKALVEVAKLPGVVAGIAASPFVPDGQGYDMAFNNQWVKAFDNINEDIKTEFLPVYVGKAIKEGNLWDNVTSTSFWATDGADGLGYMAGMMAPGMAFNYLGLGSKLLGGARRAAQMAGMSQKTETAVNVLKSLGMTGKAIDIGLGATANTVMESGAEAAGVGNDMDSKKDQYLRDYSLRLQNKQLAIDKRRQNGEITMEEANRLSAENMKVTGEESFAEQRALAMRDTFKANLAILIVPNLLMSKALFGKPVEKLVHQVEKTGMKAIAERAGNSLGRYGKAFASEGFLEEGGQSTAQTMFTNKAMKGELKKGSNSYTDFVTGGLSDFTIGDATREYVDMISSNEGHKAVFLGGMIGGPMMSYQGRKEDVANRKSTNSILEGLDAGIMNYNTIMENDIYKTDDNGGYIYKKDADGNETHEREIDPVNAIKVMRALNYKEAESKELETAINEGNQRVVDIIKQRAIFDLIAPSIQNGEAGIEALKAKLNESTQFQEIMERDSNPKTANESKEFVKNTLEEAIHIQKQNEKFKDFASDLIKLDHPTATPAQKEAYIDTLNTRYLQVKHEQYNSEKQLAKLQEKRLKLYDELDIDPDYDIFSEFPMAKMKTGTITDSDMEARAKSTRDALTNNGLVREVEAEISFLKDAIAKNKSDINGVWSGANGITKSFNTYVENDAILGNMTNQENIRKSQEMIERLSIVKTQNELDALLRELSKNDTEELVLSENPIIQEEIAKKEAELAALAEKEAQEALEKKIADEIDEPGDGVETDAPVGVPSPLDPESESIQSDKIIEVIENEDDITINEDEAIPVVEVDVPNAAHGSARLISTNRETGKALVPTLQSFVDFERVPRDKTKDKVSFALGNIYPKGKEMSIKEAMAKVKDGKTLSKEELLLLEDFLPISSIISEGENKGVSFLDSMAHPNPIVVKTNTLPLRKAIVKALIDNKGSFEGITGRVQKQEPGWLKVEEREDNTPVAKNNILELDVFTDMSESDKIKYFQKNSAYVDFFGALRHTVNNKLIDAEFGPKMQGEVFLNIPKANGEKFWLKLNINQISDVQANDLFNLMVLKFEHFNKTKSSTITLDELNDIIDTPGLKSELNNILRHSKNNTDKTVNTLIDLLIYNGNSNTRTAFGLYFKNESIIGNNGEKYKGRSGVRVGSLYNKLSGGDIFLTTINASDIIADREAFRENFKQFFKYKRHNVLIKHGTFNFTKPEYIKYLLDPANPILSTNAVVNEPTFQGFANIYLSHDVKNNAKSAKSTADLVTDTLSTLTVEQLREQEQIKKAEIEKNRLDKIIITSERAIVNPYTKEFTFGINDSNIQDFTIIYENKKIVSVKDVVKNQNGKIFEIVLKDGERVTNLDKLKINVNIDKIDAEYQDKLDQLYDEYDKLISPLLKAEKAGKPEVKLKKVIEAKPKSIEVIIKTNVVDEADQTEQTLNALKAELEGLKKFHAAGINKADRIKEVEFKISKINNETQVTAEVKDVITQVSEGNVDVNYLENLKANDKPKLMKVMKYFMKEGILTAADMKSSMSEIANKIGFSTVADLEKNCK